MRPVSSSRTYQGQSSPAVRRVLYKGGGALAAGDGAGTFTWARSSSLSAKKALSFPWDGLHAAVDNSQVELGDLGP